MPTTPARTRPRLKHVMTATAFALVSIRNTWRDYLNAVAAERRAERARRRPDCGCDD